MTPVTALLEKSVPSLACMKSLTALIDCLTALLEYIDTFVFQSQTLRKAGHPSKPILRYASAS